MFAGDAAKRFRDGLVRAGYEEGAILDLLACPALPPFRLRPAPADGGGPLADLVRLFLRADTLEPGRAGRSLEPATLADGVSAGLLEAAPAGVRAAFEVTPYRGLLLAADWPGRRGDALEVMGVASSSRALADLTVRTPVPKSLDLGTGCGVLALLCASHSGRVVATDSNPRAVSLARFNADWNGLRNVAFREGDLFEPVRGETFDLIVCNPPFVIAPAVTSLHTQSGRPSDELCRDIVRAASAHLTEGGLFQIVCNWVEPAGRDWRQRLAGWLEGRGCDAWILRSHAEDAAAYAKSRIAELSESARLEDWTAYYRREGIDAIGFGVVTLRRRAGSAHGLRFEGLAEAMPVSGTPAEKIAAVRRRLEEAVSAPPTESPR